MNPVVQNNVTIKALEEAFLSIPRTVNQQKAFDQFILKGLPTNKLEEYRFTPMAKFLEANFDLSLFGYASEGRTDLDPDHESITIHIVNGKLVFDKNEIRLAGIQVAVREVLASHQTDPFALLNLAFCEKEIQINIPENLIVSKPIFLNHILDSEAEQIMLNARILIDLGENSSCSIKESFHSLGIHPVFTNLVSEFRLQANSNLNYYRLQNDAGAYQIYNSTVKQLGKSTINSFVFSFDGHAIRNNANFSIEAEHCESNFYGLYLPSGKSLIDNHTVADHRMPNCVSNELYKGIISDSARGVFNGKIFVRPHAQKTNAFQSNRNILLSDTATINTKPQLEIWADDVKCSHGCTTGQLDKEALFYLQSRGISQEQSRAMLLSAFVSEVTQKIQDTRLKEDIEKIVAERLKNPY